MKKSLALSIPRPCAEKWEDFILTSNGGFCGSCNKSVIDFTKMSDEQIIDFFKARPAHTCGRFRPDQLKHYNILDPKMPGIGLGLLKAGFLSLLFMAASKPMLAQHSNARKASPTEYRREQTQSTGPEKKTKFISGIVRDEFAAMPGVNVIIKGTTQGTATDVDGYFQLNNVEDGSVLVFSFIGYRTAEYIVSANTSDRIALTMEMEMDVTMGEVALEEPYEEEHSRVYKWWSGLKEKF